MDLLEGDRDTADQIILTGKVFNGKLKDCIEVIQLQHFSIEKRSKWIERAKEAGLPITQEVKQGMIDSNREELEAIIGVPWTSYLVVRKAIVITANAKFMGNL